MIASSLYHDFLVSYIKNTLLYAKLDESFTAKLSSFWNWIFSLKDTRLFFRNTLIITASGVPILLLFAVFDRRKCREVDNFNISVLLYAVLIAIAALFSVVQPGRNFGHYVLFLIIPVGFLLGTVFGEISKLRLAEKRLSDSKRAFLLITTVFLLVNGVWGLPEHILDKNPYIKQSQSFKAEYRSAVAECNVEVCCSRRFCRHLGMDG